MSQTMFDIEQPEDVNGKLIMLQRGLTSFDKMLYSTFKVESVEFVRMWNEAFHRMTAEAARA